MKMFIFICSAIRFALNCIELVGLHIDPMVSLTLDYICDNAEYVHTVLNIMYHWLRTHF